MKKLLLLVLFLLNYLPGKTQCALLYEVPLRDRVEMADLVFEGQVVSKESFWNEKHNNIYTLNTVELYKIFKGNSNSDHIIVVTPGGEVGDDLIIQNPSLSLQPGERGTFLVKTDIKKPGAGFLCYNPFAGPQSFIKYDVINNAAYDIFKQYSRIANLYSTIEETTKAPFKEIKILTVGRRLQSHDGILVAPVISSWSPDTISAGTNSVFTIHGSGFGATMGTGFVSFTGADHFFTYTDINYNTNIYYHLWTDTLIKIVVPALVNHDTPGFGFFKVTNSSSLSDTSNLSVRINFGLYERILSGATVPTPIIMYQLNTNGGILFTPNDSLAGITACVNSFKRAMGTWNCASHINWTVSTTSTPIHTDVFDGTNVVMFSNSLSAGVAAYAQRYITSCSSQTSSKVYEVDVVFRGADANWQFGPAIAAGNQSDFEALAVHELGHAHDITHTKWYGSVMNGGFTRNLAHFYDDFASIQEISYSLALASNCSLTAMTLLNNPACVTGIDESDNQSGIIIYPNPCNSNFMISFQDGRIHNSEMKIYDLIGQVVKEQSIQSSRLVDCRNFSPGIYLVKISDKEKIFTHKLIVQ